MFCTITVYCALRWDLGSGIWDLGSGIWDLDLDWMPTQKLKRLIKTEPRMVHVKPSVSSQLATCDIFSIFYIGNMTETLTVICS